MLLHGVSIAQKPDELLKTIITRRLGVILIHEGKYCLEINTTSGYNNIIDLLQNSLQLNRAG